MFLLEQDLKVLSQDFRQDFNQRLQRYIWVIPDEARNTYRYWAEWLTSVNILKVLSDIDMCDEDFVRLSALARCVLAIMTKNPDGEVRAPQNIAATIEAIQLARFERKVLHLRANPQLLIDARDEVKAKRKAIRAASEPDKS